MSAYKAVAVLGLAGLTGLVGLTGLAGLTGLLAAGWCRAESRGPQPRGSQPRRPQQRLASQAQAQAQTKAQTHAQTKDRVVPGNIGNQAPDRIEADRTEVDRIEADRAEADRTEADAARAMQQMRRRGHRESPHMRMTPVWEAAPKDLERADRIVATLGKEIEPYKDYRVALADGYRILQPNRPQPEYHFNNYWNGYLETFTFDPEWPTSLLYKKTRDGYELIGAMYTAPKSATLDQLNERVPLGVTRWHAHTNVCMPRSRQNAQAD